MVPHVPCEQGTYLPSFDPAARRPPSGRLTPPPWYHPGAVPRLLGTLLLVLTTLIWGTTFVVVKETVKVVPVPLLLAVRFTVGALLLLPFGADRRVLRPGAWLGLLLFLGFAFQSLGLRHTSASRGAFLTGTCVVMVPFFAAFVFRRRVRPRLFAAAATALAGLALLCFDLAPPNRGDAWILACAVLYAWYIVALEEPVRRLGAGRLSLVQLVTVAALAWVWSAPDIATLAKLPPRAWLALLYLGAAATGLTTLLQGIAQKTISAPVTAVLFTLEPVFAALFAFLLLGEQPGPRGWIGSALILAAMLIAETGGGPEAKGELEAESAAPHP